MFPIIAIVSAISAAVSVYKGSSWAADKVTAMQDAQPAAGKADGTSKPDAKASPFEQALAAQAAGQALPSAGNAAPSTAASTPIVQTAYGTNYDSLTRIQAGIAAYGHVGERRDNHTGPTQPPATAEDPIPPVAVSSPGSVAVSQAA
jgi:hypothetical protein